jgi:3',5'-cyclic AMP phosphodiesterase CpdA
VLAGNQDDRGALRSHFDLPGDGTDPVSYAVDLGPLRLVALDSTVPGERAGALDREQIARLDGVLAASPQPTLIAMHHPPLVTGLPAWDEIGLAEASRQALCQLIETHPDVRRIVAGHVHRTIAGELAGRPVLTVSSTYVQGRLDFASRELGFSDDPGAFAIHAVVGGEMSSHIPPLV